MNGFSNSKESNQPLERFENEIKGVEFIMSKVLEDLNNTNSIIIDLRFNYGVYNISQIKTIFFYFRINCFSSF